MKIVMFSINPLFADRVMGGAPKQLQKVADHLGGLGHEVTILCTRAQASARPFRWQENVLVLPILRFKQPFPQPYAIPAHEMAAILQDVGDHLRGADRFYMHDGEFLFPYAYQDVPTVVSLRDNVYPETLLGGFLFQGDRLVAISDYSRRLYQRTMGRFFPGLAERLLVVPNGIDTAVFKPGPYEALAAELGVDPGREAILLHPHRPEPSKGLPQTIAVAALLVREQGFKNLKVLVPRWLETGVSSEVRAFYDEMQRRVHDLGLQRHFLFHDWIGQASMPAYYNLGHVTLALGHFVESFGNAPYESLACGTPAIVSRVATHRELLPETLIDKVHFDDAHGAAALAAVILRQRRRTSPATMRALQQEFSVQRQLAGYAEAILGAERSGPLRYEHPARDEATRYELAPWCYAWEEGIYHDFLAEHRALPELRRLLERYPDGFSVAEGRRAGTTTAAMEGWYRAGYLVPV